MTGRNSRYLLVDLSAVLVKLMILISLMAGRNSCELVAYFLEILAFLLKSPNLITQLVGRNSSQMTAYLFVYLEELMILMAEGDSFQMLAYLLLIPEKQREQKSLMDVRNFLG